MKKLLTVLGAVGLTATAGSAVVACKGKDVCKTPNLQALKTQIAKAEKMQQGKKSKEAFAALTKAIEEVKKVTKEEEAPDAYVKIVGAMKAFNESPDIKQVDLKEFKTAVEKIAKGEEATIDEAIVKIKAVKLPTGVTSIKVEKDTKDANKIIISFVVEQGYEALANLELTFTKKG
ncbi:lipoprotein [Mesoplasma seiffertii]|uniref:lipoprotein n=1 Tax=Mesoplasma seiffertii TaxID=28224 RepID=UPI0004B216C2|nr:lipoprotein [Mesoplasma seiffertii]